MSKLYLEIFDPERKRVFEKLAFFNKNGILAGGTALALQLGHRYSLDFDIFLPNLISRQFFRKVVRVFGKNITTRISTNDLLLIKTAENIEVHFVYLEYKNLFPPVETNSINLADLGDIAADKAYTIGRRGQWRDYVDLFFILKEKVFTLEKIMKMAEKKYRPEFNPRLFLEQLPYFGDIPDFKISFLGKSYSVREIKDFLTLTVKNFDLKKYS